MQTDIDPRTLIGHKAVDSAGAKIGTVDEVYLDDATGTPEWAAVRTGMFGRDALVPLAAAEFVDGELRVPYEKSMVKDAPDLGTGQHISPQQEMELYRYYGVEVAGEPRMPGDASDHDFGTLAGDGGEPERTTPQAMTMSGTGEAAAVGGVAAGAAAGVAVAASGSKAEPEVEPEVEPEPGHFTGSADGTVEEDRGWQDSPASVSATEAVLAEAPATTVGAAPAELTRHEEELQVAVERRVVGRARVRRYVVTEEVEKTVPVMHERVRVVREPLSAAEAAELSEVEIAEAFEEVDLHAESPVVTKVARPVERLRLVVEEVRTEETVREQVRKERFEVQDGNPDEAGPTATQNPGGGFGPTGS